MKLAFLAIVLAVWVAAVSGQPTYEERRLLMEQFVNRHSWVRSTADDLPGLDRRGDARFAELPLRVPE